MPITDKQRRWLRQQVHHLKPVVTLGQAGLSDAVLAEIELALDHHELIKIRIGSAEREERDATVQAIADRTGADLIQRIGHVASYFRPNPRKKSPLPLPAV